MEQFNYTELIAQRKATAEKQAREYFTNRKERNCFFIFSGPSDLEGDDMYKSYYFAYTQEKVNHFIQLIIELYNAGSQSEDDRATTLDDVIEGINLWEFEGFNAELDELFKLCRSYDMLLNDIDPTPRYLYSMSLFYWDSSDEKLSERIHFRVVLSHEEYLYLLTEQLARTNGFSYNDLVIERPELAQKIQKEVKALSFQGLVPSDHYPFLVIFDEVLADATRIIESDL